MKLPKTIKRIFSTASVAIATTILLPLSSVFAANIQIEGAIYAKNVTQGTAYSHAGTTAKAGETVGFEVYYHNQEAPDSGLNANNVRIKVNLPGDTAKVHTVSTTIKADNSNQVNDSTTATTDVDTTLQLTGDVTWRHNIGTNAAPNWVTQVISSDAITNPNGAIIEQVEQPCNNFAATIAFQAKVIAPSTPPPVATPPATPSPPTTPPQSSAPVTPANPAITRPTTLVNTGAGSVAGLFAVVTIAGALGRSWYISRRFNG